MEELLHGIAQIKAEEMQAIRHYKLLEIQKAWDDLFAVGIVPVLYDRHPEYVDYKIFEQSFREKLKATRGDSQNLSGKIDAEIKKIASVGDEVTVGIQLKGIEDDEFDLFDKILYLNYIPPQDWQGITQHLSLLISYYSNGNIFIPAIELRADLSLCKLIGAVNRLYGATMVKGETRLAGRKKQEKNVESGKTEVFKAFRSLWIKNKARYKGKSQIAKAIKVYLESENNKLPLEERKKVPSERTIIRYMDSDDKIVSDLIEMGVIKDKPTLVK
jgi:hypothetical protein